MSVNIQARTDYKKEIRLEYAKDMQMIQGKFIRIVRSLQYLKLN